MKQSVYFVSGIDTDCGKTIATGLLAKHFLRKGIKVITQKLVQTGCNGIAEDIIAHRKLMNIDLLEEDLNFLTCPYVLEKPSSPHLAAKAENMEIDMKKITDATKILQKSHDLILLEGAGGLYVPIKRDFLIIDFIKQMGYPLILVTSAKVGSINHTLMSLELCKKHEISISAVIYNHFPSDDKMIINDSKMIFEEYLSENFIGTPLIEIPHSANLSFQNIDFKDFLFE